MRKMTLWALIAVMAVIGFASAPAQAKEPSVKPLTGESTLIERGPRRRGGRRYGPRPWGGPRGGFYFGGYYGPRYRPYGYGPRIIVTPPPVVYYGGSTACCY